MAEEDLNLSISAPIVAVSLVGGVCVQFLAWGAPTGANGVLYVPIATQLYVLDAESGDQLNMFETGGSNAAGGAAIAAGRVVVSSGLQYPLSASVFNNQIICYGLPD